MDWLVPALLGFAAGSLAAYYVGHAAGYDKALNKRLNDAMRKIDRARGR